MAALYAEVRSCDTKPLNGCEELCRRICAGEWRVTATHVSVACPRKSICSLPGKQLFKRKWGKMVASAGNPGESSSLLLAMPMKKIGCCLPCTCFPHGSPGEITVSLFCEFPVHEAGHEEGPLRRIVVVWVCLDTLELPSWHSGWRPLCWTLALRTTGQQRAVPGGAGVELQDSEDTPGSLSAHQVLPWSGTCAPAVTREF